MRKVLFVGFIMAALAIVLTACSKANKVTTGTYRADDGMAKIIVQDEHSMLILGPIEVSAAFSGEYVVEGDELILKIGDEEDYIFFIKEQALVLKSGAWLENWVEQGSVFYLSED